MTEEKTYKISERYLNELIQHHGTSLVGKVCKRFEILVNKEDIKANTRELIYEELRAFRNDIISYNEGGKERFVFNFKK